MYRKIPRRLPELCPSEWANPTRPTHDAPNECRDGLTDAPVDGRDSSPAPTIVLRCAEGADIVAAGGAGRLIELATQPNLAGGAALLAGAAVESDQRGEPGVRTQIDAAGIGTQHEVATPGRDHAVSGEEHDRRHCQ